MASHESEDTEPTETQVFSIEPDGDADDASPACLVWGKLVALGDQATIVLKGDGVFNVGRSKSASFTIANPVISNTHLAFEAESGSRWTVTDTSTNGTLLSRAGVAQRLIKGSPTPLVPGDTLRLSNIDAPIEVDEHLAYIFHPVVANPGGSPRRGKRKADAADHDASEPGEPQAQRQKLETRPSADGDVDGDVDGGGGGGGGSAAEGEMEQTLECSICREVYHDPVGLIPCLHCICAGCWVALSASSPGGSVSCPECRATVQAPKRNIVVAQLAEAFLKEHPDKRRPQDDTDRLDQLSAALLDGLKQTEAAAGAAAVAASSDGDDYSDSDDYDEDGGGPPLRTCPECLTARQGDGHLCPDDGTAIHDGCSCCGQFLPVRTGLVDTPTKCQGCLRTFCCAYFGGPAGCRGCANAVPGAGSTLQNLVLLKDVTFAANTLQADCLLGHHSIHQCILNSRAERRILADHVSSQGMDPTMFFKDLVARSRAGTLDVPIPGDAADNDGICRTCARDFFCKAAYKWRDAVPSADLPATVTARGNCWYGQGCRTQYNPSNPGHGERLNHICAATTTR